MEDKKARLQSSVMECKDTVDAKMSECYDSVCASWAVKTEDKRKTSGITKAKSNPSRHTKSSGPNTGLGEEEVSKVEIEENIVFRKSSGKQESKQSQSQTHTPSLSINTTVEYDKDLTDTCAQGLDRLLQNCCY